MDDVERLQAQAFMARNRVAELQQQLEATQRNFRELSERLTLSEHERKVLEGHEDGCVRVNELYPIIRRVFGEAA
jgi:hypothetical protein